MIHFRKRLLREHFWLGVHIFFGSLSQSHQVDVDALSQNVVDHFGRLLGHGGVEQTQTVLLLMRKRKKSVSEMPLFGGRCAITSAILNVTLRPSLSSSAWHMASTQDSASRLAERMQSTRPIRNLRVEALS